MVYFIQYAGLDPLQLVLVGTALEVAIFIFEIPTGIVADVRSRRLSVIIGTWLIGAGFLVEGSFPHFLPILAAQLLWGVGYTFTSGALEAWISDEIGEENAAVVFMSGAKVSQIGALSATLVSVALAQRYLNTPILIGGGLFLLLALYLMRFMPEEGFRPTPPGQRTTWQQMGETLRSGMGMLRLRPALVGILLIGLFFGLYSEGYDRLWNASLLERFSLPAIAGLAQITWFGLIEGGSYLLAALATWWVEKRVNLNSLPRLVRLLGITSLLLVGALFGYATAGSLGFAIGLIWSISALREVIYPLYIAWVNHRLDPAVRATVLSMSGQVDAIGQIAGGPALGLVAKQVSIQAGLLGSAALLTPVLLLIAWQAVTPAENKPA